MRRRLAKQLASLDVLCRGRLVFGMGVGYLEPELAAVGVPMHGRGARAEEYLRAIRSLWEDPSPQFRGQHVAFTGIDAHPRPCQPSIPVVVGGHGPHALRRAVRCADGWYGFRLDRTATAAHLAALHREARLADRDPTGISVTVTSTEPLDRDVVRDYAAMGVHRLALLPPHGLSRGRLSAQDWESYARANAPEVHAARPR